MRNSGQRESPAETEELRRASPLWLRPVGAGDPWRLLTFAFQARFLPGRSTARVYLLARHQGRHAGWPDELTRRRR